MATIYEPQVGDAVRVDDDPRPWRVDAKDPVTGMLTLEAMRSINRLTMSEVHEFRVQKAGAFV